jgi:hypothetical protein
MDGVRTGGGGGENFGGGGRGAGGGAGGEGGGGGGGEGGGGGGTNTRLSIIPENNAAPTDACRAQHLLSYPCKAVMMHV